MEERMTAQQLADWRKGYGWTQAQAAGLLGLSYDGYVKKEQGQRHISRQDMKLIGYINRDATKKKATA